MFKRVLKKLARAALPLGVALLLPWSAGAAQDFLEPLRKAASSDLRATNCAAKLNAWNRQAAVIDPQSLFQSSPSSQARLKAADLQTKLFSTRLALRTQVAKLSPAERRACLSPLKSTYNLLRAFEELAFEWRVRHGGLARLTGSTPAAFDSRWTSTNPKFQDWRFQPGDIIIERGTNFISAFIARVSDDPSVFSHLILVGQDGAGRLHVVQSEGNTDATTTPLEQWRTTIGDDAGARFALYRFNDPGLAAKAARFAYDQVSRRQRAGNPIRYDFHIDEKDHSTLFCTEIAQWAYEHASRGQVHLPEFESTLYRYRTAPLHVLDKMEIWARKFFEPGDLDTDPRFELVAEYRDFGKLRAAREADAISDAMIRWASQLHYELAADPFLSAATNVAVGLKQVITALPFSDQTPAGMAEVVVHTQSIGEAIQAVISAADETYIRKTGTALTPEQLRVLVEKLRRRDCQRFLRDPGSSVFHEDFSLTQRTCQI